jgi:hypothetical protein
MKAPPYHVMAKEVGVWGFTKEEERGEIKRCPNLLVNNKSPALTYCQLE